MSKNFCIANWKMYLNNKESVDFINDFKKNNLNKDTKVIICPSFLSIRDVSYSIDDFPIYLGAQDVSSERIGPYTSQISIDTLEEAGCSYCILGHSEKRLYGNETNEHINKKFKAINKSEIVPIICIGESLNDKKNNITEKVLKKQLEGIFANITLNVSKDCIIAYEPLWAIGTGISADKKTIRYCHNFIKKIIQKITQNNRNIYILYGGSVDETNASNILSIENVDGFLVGSASITSNSFYNIYNKF